jgi:hypothetical protein
MNESPTSVINIDDEQIIAAVRSVTRRLLIMAPGLSESVALAVSEKWKTLGAPSVNVIVDVDPEVCRLGYGDLKALQLLESVARVLGTTIHHQPGIRIGLVVADETTLIYAPTPLVVESRSLVPTHPNGIRLSSVPAEVAKEVGLDSEQKTEQIIGTQPVCTEDVNAAVSDLAENPPRKFDLMQKVHVFNAAFEFVEFKLEGCSIARKTVRLPSEFVGLGRDPKTQKMLRSTFRLIDEDSGSLSGGKVIKLKEFVSKKFLVNLPNYGNVVLRTNKADFEKAVSTLRRYVARFQKRIERDLQRAIDNNRKTLVEALTPAVANNLPPQSLKHIGRNPDRDTVKSWLDVEMRNLFGDAKSYLSRMEVSLLFKGVTYESLSDANFIEVAQEKLPMLKQLHEEFDTAKEKPENPARENLFPESLFDESSKTVN